MNSLQTSINLNFIIYIFRIIYELIFVYLKHYIFSYNFWIIFKLSWYCCYCNIMKDAKFNMFWLPFKKTIYSWCWMKDTLVWTPCTGLIGKVFITQGVVWIRVTLVVLLLGFYSPLVIYQQKNTLVSPKIYLLNEFEIKRQLNPY